MKQLKIALIIIAAVIVLFALYRMLFIRIVNYDIGGVKIPSYYNRLTGGVKPIQNYTGTANLPTVESRKMNKAGLTEPETAGAEIRWSAFEKWVKTQPEYALWQSNPEVFRKAQDDFKKNVAPRIRAIVIK